MTAHKYVAEYGAGTNKACRLCAEPEAALIHLRPGEVSAEEFASCVPPGTDAAPGPGIDPNLAEALGAIFNVAQLEHLGRTVRRISVRGTPNDRDVRILADALAVVIAHVMAIQEQRQADNVAELEMLERLRPHAPRAIDDVPRVHEFVPSRPGPGGECSACGCRRASSIHRRIGEPLGDDGYGTSQEHRLRRVEFALFEQPREEHLKRWWRNPTYQKVDRNPLASPAAEAEMRRRFGDGDGAIPPTFEKGDPVDVVDERMPFEGGPPFSLREQRLFDERKAAVDRMVEAQAAARMDAAELSAFRAWRVRESEPDADLVERHNALSVMLDDAKKHHARELAEMTAQRDRWMRKESEANHHAAKQCQKLEAQRDEARATAATAEKEAIACREAKSTAEHAQHLAEEKLAEVRRLLDRSEKVLTGNG